LLLNRRG